jgi:uncharacterized membrane protein
VPADARELPGLPTVTLTKMHQGPLPDPETLAAYDRQLPGTSERLIRLLERPIEMAEQQQQHRIRLESRVVTSDIRRGWAGLAVGTVVAVGVVIGGIVLALNDKPVEGLAALIVALGGPLAAFLYTDHQRRVERQGRHAADHR